MASVWLYRSMSFSEQFLSEVAEIVRQPRPDTLEAAADQLSKVRGRGGRLFIPFLGVGGSAGNAGHAVNDFRKLCGFFEAYALTRQRLRS